MQRAFPRDRPTCTVLGESGPTPEETRQSDLDGGPQKTCPCPNPKNLQMWPCLENIFAGKLEHLGHAGGAGGWCPQGEGRCHVKTGRQTAGQSLAVGHAVRHGSRVGSHACRPRSLHRELGVRASRLKGKVCLSEPPIGELRYGTGGPNSPFHTPQ